MLCKNEARLLVNNHQGLREDWSVAANVSVQTSTLLVSRLPVGQTQLLGGLYTIIQAPPASTSIKPACAPNINPVPLQQNQNDQ